MPGLQKAEMPQMSEAQLERVNQMKVKILENPHVKSFIEKHEEMLTKEVIERGMTRLSEFVRNRAAFEAGKTVNGEWLEPILIMNVNYPDVTYRKTDKQLELELLEKTSKALKKESIVSDNSIIEATFKSFVANTPAEQKAKRFAVDVAERYINGENFTTVLMGDVGSGKSHLAMSILNQVNIASFRNGNPKRVLFVSFPELIGRIKESFNDYESRFSEERMLELMRGADLLVIDDAGRESNLSSGKSASDWLQRFVFKLFDNDTPKIITTNLTENGLVSIYNAGNASRILRNSAGNVFSFAGISDKRKGMNVIKKGNS